MIAYNESSNLSASSFLIALLNLQGYLITQIEKYVTAVQKKSLTKEAL